jgi:hypothetical protein
VLNRAAYDVLELRFAASELHLNFFGRDFGQPRVADGVAAYLDAAGMQAPQLGCV